MTVQTSIFDISQMTEDIENLTIVGRSGSGKSLLLREAVKSISSDVKTYVITTNDFEFSLGANIECWIDIKELTFHEVTKWLELQIEQYEEFSEGQKTVLIIEDSGIFAYAMLAAKSKILNDTVAKIVNSKSKKIWLSSQIPLTQIIDRSLMCKMAKVVMARSRNGNILTGFERSVFESYDENEVRQLCDLSKSGRAIYWEKANKWYQMPVINN